MRNAYTRLFVHVVWATENREPVIDPELESVLTGAIREKCRELGCPVVALGAAADHVHLLARLAPAVSVATLVGQVKGVSAHSANHRPDRGPRFQWQRSYGAFSLDAERVPDLAAYIANQKHHHAQRTVLADSEWMAHDD
jgi:putative transposase